MTGETWSIQEVARRAGTTSRTLRHYQAVGLLEPTEVGPNGYRRYGAEALVRLQRILLLRELGMGLAEIAEVLNETRDPRAALRAHRRALEEEKERLTRRIASVERTITAIDRGEDPMTEDMFDGFDHSVHEREVVERWGADAYASSDSWWRNLSDTDKNEWTARSRALAADWVSAAERGIAPESAEGRALAARHVEWLGSIPGTPGSGGSPVAEYVTGLAEMYVADERFSATYGGAVGAAFVRDALVAYATSQL
jgi:DNA-binding transcriptional MerR regulator